VKKCLQAYRAKMKIATPLIGRAKWVGRQLTLIPRKNRGGREWRETILADLEVPFRGGWRERRGKLEHQERTWRNTRSPRLRRPSRCASNTA